MKKWNSKPHRFSDQQIQKNIPNQKYKPVLNNTSVKLALEKLQHEFVVALIDKTAKGSMLLPSLKNLNL